MDLAVWIADQPCLMPVCIEPVNFQTGTIFLSAPAAATLYVENVHVESPRPCAVRTSTQPRRAFRECNRESYLQSGALFRLHRNLERRRRTSFPCSQPAPTRRWNQGLVHPDRKAAAHRDRKSTRLNSSHVEISYAVFCLKKKKQ